MLCFDVEVLLHHWRMRAGIGFLSHLAVTISELI
jgi:hypothetical protein